LDSAVDKMLLLLSSPPVVALNFGNVTSSGVQSST